MKEEDKWMVWNGKQISFPVPDGVRLPIYCMGDSHIIVLVECAPDIFRKHNVQIFDAHICKTAHAMGSGKDNGYINQGLTSIPEGSVVLLSFGEIDTRHYIPRLHRENGIPMDELIDEVMDRYTKNCVRVLIERFRIAILGPYVCPDDLEHHCEIAGQQWYNDFPSIVRAKKMLNTRLAKYAIEHGCLYVPMFRVGLENNWHTDGINSYFNDHSHLGPCMIPVILDSMKDFKWKGFDYDVPVSDPD